jgi:hypothetical protein
MKHSNLLLACLALLAFEYAAGQAMYPPHWIAASTNVELHQAHNVIYKVTGGTSYNAGARSLDSLSNHQDGIVECHLGTAMASTVLRAFGLADTDPDFGYTSIDYAIWFNGSNNQVRAYKAGTLLATTTAASTDVLQIIKSDTTITYKVGTTTLATTSVPTNKSYFIDTSIQGEAGFWEGITSNFPAVFVKDWYHLSGFTTGSGTLSKPGTGQAYAVAKNAFLTPTGGSVEYVNDTTAKHAGAWGFGFHKNSRTSTRTDWKYGVYINATCTQMNCLVSGSLVNTSTIGHGSVITMQYMGDRMVWMLNGTVVHSVYAKFYDPLVLQFHSAAGTGQPLPLANFRLMFDTLRTGFATSADVDTGNGVARLKYIGLNESKSSYLWSREYITESEWDDEFDNFPADVQEAFNGMDYDDVFLTDKDTVLLREALDGRAYIVDEADNTYPVDYSVSYKADVHTQTGYAFSNNVLEKSGSGNRFLLKNGVVVGQNDGDVSWEVIEPRTGTLYMGLSQVGATYSTLAAHITNCFRISGGSMSVVLNGTQSSFLGRIMRGDLLTMKVNGDSLHYYHNSRLVYSGKLAANTMWFVEAMYVSSSTGNAVKLRKLGLDNIISPKKPRPVITHASCDGVTLGSIGFKMAPCSTATSVTYTLTCTPLSYSSFNSTGNFTGLVPGLYTLTAASASCSFSYTIEIGYLVDWNYLTAGLTESDGGATITNSSPNQWDSARSVNGISLPDAGWIEWTENNVVSGVTSSGLRSVDNNERFSFTTLYNYGVVVKAVAGESCNQSIPGVFPDDLSQTRRFRISWDATNIRFGINSLTYTMQCTASSAAGMYRMFLRMFGSQAQNVSLVRASFPCMSAVPVASELHRKLDAGYVIVPDDSGDDYLRFRYYEEYNVTAATYNIYKIGATGSTLQDTGNVDVIYGDNRVNLNLTDLDMDASADFYMLEVINSKNEKWYLKFKY